MSSDEPGTVARVRSGRDQWRIVDTFHKEWRFWIVPPGERRTGRVSRWDMPGEPLFHIIPQAFADWGARDDETARALLSIYDALTGSHLYDEFPQPTVDRRRRLRGFDAELSRALYAALEAGILRFERHEVPWPFPERDDKNEERRNDGPKEEDETFLYKIRLHDSLHEPCASVPYRLEPSSGPSLRGTTDGGGLLEQRLPKRQQTVRIFYAPQGSDDELVQEVIVIPETISDEDYVAHLRNMGFGRSDARRTLLAFQGAHRTLKATGTLDDNTKSAITAMVTGQMKSATRG